MPLFLNAEPAYVGKKSSAIVPRANARLDVFDREGSVAFEIRFKQCVVLFQGRSRSAPRDTSSISALMSAGGSTISKAVGSPESSQTCALRVSRSTTPVKFVLDADWQHAMTSGSRRSARFLGLITTR